MVTQLRHLALRDSLRTHERKDCTQGVLDGIIPSIPSNKFYSHAGRRSSRSNVLCLLLPTIVVDDLPCTVFPNPSISLEADIRLASDITAQIRAPECHMPVCCLFRRLHVSRLRTESTQGRLVVLESIH